IPSNLINTSLDRSNYPQGAAVHVTLTDFQLNIDPTDEDSWTWDTNSSNNRMFYQAFDENGATESNGAAGMIDITPSQSALMFEKNGRLTVNLAAQGTPVAVFGNNNDQRFNPATLAGDFAATAMTFTELGKTGGIFGNYDEADNANLDITADAARGKSATIRYNDVTKSIVVGFGFGSIDINAPDGQWGSGEEIPVTLVDSDENKNSRADEDLDLNANTTSLIPALKKGTPFTLKSGDRAILTSGAVTIVNSSLADPFTAAGANATALMSTDAGVQTQGVVQNFAQRAILQPNATVIATSLIIDFGGRTAADLFKSINNPQTDTFDGLNMFNYDVRSITSASGTWYILNSTGRILTAGGESLSTVTAISIANVTSGQGLVNINGSATETEVLNGTTTT
ncbi:MAG: hypothetical protein ACRD32_07830, partial [Nitrososphaerales archaeon]